MKSIGINIGSSSLKTVVIEDGKELWSEVIPHEGDFQNAVISMLNEKKPDPGIPLLVTGTEGRYLLAANSVIEPVCVEKALEKTGHTVDAVVSMGGEDLVVYTVDRNGKITNNFSGSKCASGTGEFFKQQLARMDMTLDNVNRVSEESKVCSLSARCSVFMKSDCTHKLNKKEATKDDIVVSLSDVMATKVCDFLNRAKIESGRVLLSGGITRNKHILRYMKEKTPDIEYIIPEEAPYFEALGAAHLAVENGSPLPKSSHILKDSKIRFDRYKDLKSAAEKVQYFETEIGTVKKDREYILGIDGGSTTTKACLVDIETYEIVAAHYGRTHGDPVRALQNCIIELRKKINKDVGDPSAIKISLAATTGSSREILGVFMETGAVYNEIIAHSYGTTFFSKDVDTIFEIGGQDAKYVLLENKVPVDYAMNEACSAGTGSFLEESAAGDLNIAHAWEIGEIALKAENPLKFGEHCSAFINSDIRKAIQQGARREDITAGIVTSIVSNYLNRVVGNRTIGKKIFLQGGVAKNKAVPLAFAMLLDKEILVPPAPELMGCFGVAVLAGQKLQEGLIEKKMIDLGAALDTEIKYEKVFTCKSCENFCPIQVLNVNGHKYMFGGRCSKYANSKKKTESHAEVINYIDKRNEMMFNTFAPPAEDFNQKRAFTVGIPRCFSIHSLYPLYSWFFHELGIKTVLSDEIAHEGVARAESTYCFPAEIAHGAVQDIINKKTDYIFVPHFRDMPSMEKDVHANFCPITQSLPYYIKKAFPHVPEEKLIPLIVTFKFGEAKALEFFYKLGEQLSIPESEIKSAFRKGVKKQEEYLKASRKMGKEALERAREEDHPVIALLGRPYNAFTPEANMGIPRKFSSRGFSIIPFDILPEGDEEIFENMYWYYGQLDMKAAARLKDEPNVYVTFITNFSCAPDSFILHYLKWMMGTKPFLILELDSHSADAGVDTRIEAFLDIIEGYRSRQNTGITERYDNGLRFINNGKDPLHLMNEHNGESIPIMNNKKVKMLLSNMGDLSTAMMASIVRKTGINAQALPVADSRTLQLARSHASGKECVPSHLVLGSALKFINSEEYRKDEIYLLFVPITTGPCRTGQYFVFYENLFRDMRLENIVVVTLSADNSYTELGPNFSKHMWHGLVISDYMKDVQTSLRACAEDPDKALQIYTNLWHDMIRAIDEDFKNAYPALKKAAQQIAQIPLKKTIHEVPRVLIVGEIYVRRDDFAVDELVELMSRKNIIAKVSGISEWIHYLDFVREYDLKKRLKLKPWYARPFAEERRKLITLSIESAWKHAVERKAKRMLKSTDLIPHTPHDMKKIMHNTSENFVNLELNSEIAISSGVAATAMEEGYSGIVNISPFACLIGRVIEGLITPWAREKNYPVFSLEVDGNILPPNIVNKLNIFMMNVLRFNTDPDSSELIEFGEEEKQGEEALVSGND
ncbi:MAG: acyl-CoA dehydratase activase [Spirochaetales bacterium]|nr:acyl-CoA dehydratase activase [Spirochaetales bacterium]